MKNYEIMFILSTQLTDEEKQAGVALVENGYYVLTLFQIDGTRIPEVEAKLNITESILKYMIVKND